MFDALKARLEQLKTVGERALPAAAESVRDKLRADVDAGRRAGQKRRKAERTRRKAAGDKRRVSMGRRGSGVQIRTAVVGSAVVVTASAQVHKIARDQSESAEWLRIFGEEVRAAAAPKGKR